MKKEQGTPMEGAPLLSLALNYTVEKPSCQRPSPDFSDCHKTHPIPESPFVHFHTAHIRIPSAHIRIFGKNIN